MNTKRKLNVLIWDAHHLEADKYILEYIHRVQEVFDGHQVRIVKGPKAYERNLDGVEVLVAWTFHPEILPQAPMLEWVQFGSSGINHALSPQLLESKVRLTTLKGVHATPMAEHALAMMMAFTRGVHTAVMNQTRSSWDRSRISPASIEFEGSTVGIIGMGRIGCSLARKVRSLGARVAATRSSQTSSDEADIWVEKDDLKSLLSQSDWVVVTVPLTEETHQLISGEQLKCMPAHAVLINISRGQIVDETALIAALQNGQIGGACLDVFEKEPLPEDSPLWRMPNVIITPHTGGMTQKYVVRGAEVVAANLKAFLAGETMPTEFDRNAGY